MFGKHFRLGAVSLLLAVNVQAQVRDTIFKRSTLLTGKDALLLGAFTVGTAAIFPLDKAVASRLQIPWAQENHFLKTAATGFRLLGDPGSFVTGAGLYLVGRAQKNQRVEAVGLHSVESILFADVLAGGLKFLAGRQRPFVDIDKPYDFQLWRGFSDDKYRSFPSGHTTTAFAFASTVTRESQFWWPHGGFYVGTIMYGGAGLVGLSRIYNNQHWASDVMAGATIGTLIGLKVVKYTHSHPGNQIDSKLVKGKRSVSVPVTILTIRF